MRLKSIICITVFILTSITNSFCTNNKETYTKSPRIINIINFIRQTDYRLENADEQLFETVMEQIKLVNKYDFPATFLFQYDALINPAYQKLMKTRLNSKCEIGAWWEITQPHVEAAGIEWRGNHSWVSTANIAFTTGYSPEERERLVDVYMAKFKDIYGKYPRSVGSWYIDSHTLAYMYDKYGIIASCNCKDQVGTDGYTLWGGYWNQAYYPSRKNAYMPAQTIKGQIPVPIFRMLGSDPIYQYDNGIGGNGQGVISLEPVYHDAGKNRNWVNYFLESIVNQPSLAFNYAQAGQENSFTWGAMQEGLEMQFTILDSLMTVGKIRIETLEHSGNWFREQFKVTPATAITTLVDIHNQGNKTVWYNSRFYRANLLWENDGFCFRDIHLFNENFESDYLRTPGTGNQFFYFTLPVIDRFFWSTSEDRVGLRIIKTNKNGEKEEIIITNPIVTESGKGILKVVSTDKIGNKFTISFHENKINISCSPKEKDLNWSLGLRVPKQKANLLPFTIFEEKAIKAKFKNFNYKINCIEGTVEGGNATDDYIFSLIPYKDKIIIDCSGK
ncbi:MAG: hypothetical protein BGO29_14660 [Bacteroidales bacterium 36-12]|nr:MAG: hypothetical protein BGO29_14660 [Bacteroidales bacterium 36-12]